MCVLVSVYDNELKSVEISTNSDPDFQFFRRENFCVRPLARNFRDMC